MMPCRMADSGFFLNYATTNTSVPPDNVFPYRYARHSTAQHPMSSRSATHCRVHGDAILA